MSKEPHGTTNREYRNSQRHEMWQDYGGVFEAVCGHPGCTRPPTDMHEIINRGLTPKNSEIRRLTYKKTLCVLLCRDCHSKAHNPEERSVLLMANAKRYGMNAVKSDFEAVIRASNGLINIKFPEEL